MDQLPGQRGLHRPPVQHRRRVLVLPRRPAPAADPLPLQQRPARRRRPLPVRPRRRHRRLLEPGLAADPARARRLHLPPRPRVHGHRRGPRRHPRGDDVPGAARGDARGVADAGHQRPADRRPRVAVRRRRVLPVGRPGRRHELPAQPVHGRGPRRGRRGLPPDRVPRAPRPLRLVRVLGAGGGVRHVARGVPRGVPGLGPAARRGARRADRLGRPRLAAGRGPPGDAGARAG